MKLVLRDVSMLNVTGSVMDSMDPLSDIESMSSLKYESFQADFSL